MSDYPVGPRVLADGTAGGRAGTTGEIVVGHAHGRYAEASCRGNVILGSTAAAGVAPGTALSTTPPLCLWNPLNSTVMLSVLKASLGYVSGTLGAGTIVYAYVTGQTAVPTGGTELQPNNGLVSPIAGAGRLFQGSTVSATPTILYGTGWSLTALAAASAVTPALLQDEPSGLLCVPPATALVLQGIAAAGTSPLVIFGLAWEEIPVK